MLLPTGCISLLILIIVINFINFTTAECERKDEKEKYIQCTIKGSENLTTINNINYKLSYKRLVILSNSLTILPENALDFPEISHLFLILIKLNEINLNAFANLYNLEDLRIASTELKAIRKDALNNLSDLKILYINNNKQLRQIESGAFDSLIALTTLNLAKNHIESIPDNLFDSLSNLVQLNFESNHLMTLPDYLFFKCPSLLHVNFNDNLFANIPVDLFQTQAQTYPTYHTQNEYWTSNLESLTIQFNPLTNFSKWNYLHKLKQLYLKSDLIEHIDADVFENMGNLEELNLYNNSIRNISHINWSRLTKLKTLSLRGNYLRTFNGIIFKDLNKLTELDLSGNSLTEITLAMFNYTTKLQTLTMTYNFITKIDATVFSRMTRLTDLNLFQNRITTIESGAFLHTPLISLSLQSNQLSELQFGMFDSLHNGKVVATSRLQSLYLLNNNLTKLQVRAFEPLKNLRTLDISRNYINELPENLFEHMTKLQNIDLTTNPIKELPKNLLKPLANSLLKFVMQNTKLTVLKNEVFSHLKKLTILNVRFNEIISIDEDLLNLPNLREVNLANNQIRYLPKDLLHGVDCQVERLFIQGNRLAFIDDEFFDNTHLRILTFARNPWMCKCLDLVIDALRKNDISFDTEYFGGDQPTCIAYKNNTCVKDISLNDELYKQYTNGLGQYPFKCENKIFC